MKRMKTKAFALIILCSLGMGFTGCDPTIPDLKPYADATAGMTKAINQAFDETEDVFEEGIQCTDRIRANELKTQFTNYQKSVKTMRGTMNAMVAYSDSLAALAEAGNKGSESVHAVGDSYAKLASSLHPFLSIPQIPENIVSTIAAVNGYLAKIRAKRKLRDATEVAGEGVKKIAVVLELVMDQQLRLNRASKTQLLICNERDHQRVKNYYERLVADEEKAMNEMTLISEFQSRPDDLVRYQNLRQVNLSLPAAPSLDALKLRRREVLADAKSWREERIRVEGDYKVYKSTETSLSERSTRIQRTLTLAKEAVRVWAETHSNIEQALQKESRRAAALALFNLAKELSEIYKKKEDK